MEKSRQEGGTHRHHKLPRLCLGWRTAPPRPHAWLYHLLAAADSLGVHGIKLSDHWLSAKTTAYRFSFQRQRNKRSERGWGRQTDDRHGERARENDFINSVFIIREITYKGELTPLSYQTPTVCLTGKHPNRILIPILRKIHGKSLTHKINITDTRKTQASTCLARGSPPKPPVLTIAR